MHHLVDKLIRVLVKEQHIILVQVQKTEDQVLDDAFFMLLEDRVESVYSQRG